MQLGQRMGTVEVLKPVRKEKQPKAAPTAAPDRKVTLAKKG